MKRVMIIGNAGGGKSRLARAVSAQFDLTYHPLDHLLWQPGWVRTPDTEFRAAHDLIIAADRWVIDGFGPWQSIEARMARSDTIIFVDLPLRTHLWWATKRQIASLFVERKDGPEGCPMWQVTGRLYAMIWHMHTVERPRIATAIGSTGRHAQVIHITTPRALNKLLSHPERLASP